MVKKFYKIKKIYIFLQISWIVDLCPIIQFVKCAEIIPYSEPASFRNCWRAAFALWSCSCGAWFFSSFLNRDWSKPLPCIFFPAIAVLSAVLDWLSMLKLLAGSKVLYVQIDILPCIHALLLELQFYKLYHTSKAWNWQASHVSSDIQSAPLKKGLQRGWQAGDSHAKSLSRSVFLDRFEVGICTGWW